MKNPFPLHPTLAGSRSSVSQYLIVALIVIAIAAAGIPFRPIVGYRTISLFLLLVVTLLSLRFGRGPVLCAAGIAALGWNFLYIPPLYTFAIGHVEDVMMVMAFFVVTSVTGVLTSRIRERERAVTARERRTAALFALTNDLSSAHSQDEVMEAGIANIRKHLSADVVMYLGEPDGEMPPNPHPASTWKPSVEEAKAAAWSYWNEKRAGRSTTHHPEISALFQPITGPRYSLGVLGIRLHEHGMWNEDLDTLLSNFVKQIGVAAEREFLNEMNKQAILVAESERLYRTLFNSISHEFRTPIAAILGSVEHLLDHATLEDDPLVRALFEEILSATERLNRLVANLLDISRLESGLIRPKSDWCDLRDVINAALSSFAKECPSHRVSVDAAEDLPLLRADFGLLEQSLGNIIHNALCYTPPQSRITIGAACDAAGLTVTVADDGPGIPESELGKIFDKFYRSGASAAGGIGLGLTIAKGFAEAQGGSLTARNRDNGGAEFIMRFPLDRTMAVA